MKAFFIFVVLSASAFAQILDLSAGTSTLTSATGGQVTAYLPNSTAYVGAGFVGNHFEFGAGDTLKYHGNSVTLGDRSFSASLDGAGFGVQLRGITVERTSTTQSLSAFVGLTGAGYYQPFFSATRGQNFGAGIFYGRQFGKWKSKTLAVVSGNQKTLAQSVSYQGVAFRAYGTGGIFAGTPSASGAASYTVRTINVTAVRSDNFLNGQRLTSNSVNAGAGVGHFTAGAGIYRGTSTNRPAVNGASAFAALRFSVLQVSTNWYSAAGRSVVSTTASESTRHWSMAESVSGHSVGFGGGFHNNVLAVTVNQSIVFLPAVGFRRVESVSVTFHVPRTDTTVTAASVVLPDGSMRWSGYAQDYASGPLKGSSHPAAKRRRASGRFVVRGLVRDAGGLPVDGAAVALGSEVVFSNSVGEFFVRERKNRPLALRVLPAEFIAPGSWGVVACPDSASPDVEVLITVARAQQ